MPAETKTASSAGTDAETPTKGKKSVVSTSKGALARITLLDGSILDVTIDRKAKGRDLLNSICAGLNIIEKDYFGLTYDTPTDPRVWLDLEKPVSKFFRADPWVLNFAVKFYPPEPSQLQEDITRYHLCLQIRNDILEERLPCTFVTHALLGSYLVQSEMGDYDPKEMNDRKYLKDFKIAPSVTTELQDKVVDLHKTHKGQSPAEAELHYLENAKKLAMYGVDLHPAKDSEGVDIMLGVCASGLLVYRDKLRINRFAWPKILKISYKRHHFYIKIRPGDFEQYESTIGFKLANHQAAKKLWKSCVEHHTFFRLMTPEQPNKGTLFPRFGSKYRYSGRTMYESKKNPVDRAAPKFDRSLSGRRLTSRSMDALAMAEKEKDAQKRHTMGHPPEHIPDLDSPRSRSPLKKDKKEKLKRESSTGTASASSQSSLEGDYETGDGDGTEPKAAAVACISNEQVLAGSDADKDAKFREKKLKEKEEKERKEKEKLDKEKERKEKELKDKAAKAAAGGINGNDDLNDSNKSDKSGRGFGVGGLFGSGRKSKSGSPTKESKDKDKSGKGRKAEMVAADLGLGGGGADGRKGVKIRVITSKFDPASKRIDAENGNVEHSTGILDPATGLIETKYGLIDPRKGTLTALNPKSGKKETYQGQIDPKSGNIHLVNGVVDPKTGRIDDSLGQIICIDDDGVEKRIKITVITSKLDPATKRVDAERGNVEQSSGILDPATGVIETKFGLIDPKKGTLSVLNPKTGKKDIYQGEIDPKTGNVHFVNGIVDPQTGRFDNSLGQIICIGDDGVKKRVKITVITSKFDPASKRIDAENGNIEDSTGVLDPVTGLIETKYGLLDPKKGTLLVLNPKTGRKEVYQGEVDPKTGNLHLVKGVIDPNTGRVNDNLGQIICIGAVEEPAFYDKNRTSQQGVYTRPYEYTEGADGDTSPTRKSYIPGGFRYDQDPNSRKRGSDGQEQLSPGSQQKKIGLAFNYAPGGEDALRKTAEKLKTGQLSPRTRDKLNKGQLSPKTRAKLLKDANLSPTTRAKLQQGSAVDAAGIPVSDAQKRSYSPTKGQGAGYRSGAPGSYKPLVDPTAAFLESQRYNKEPGYTGLGGKDGVGVATGIDEKGLPISPAGAGKDGRQGGAPMTPTRAAPSLAGVAAAAAAAKPKKKRVKIMVITSKFDPANKRVDAENGNIEHSTGILDPVTGLIETKYGLIDPKKGTLTALDTRTGKKETYQGEVDPKTGNLHLINGVADPNTGRIDESLGQVISITPQDDPVVELIVITSRIDPATGKIDTVNGEVERSLGVLNMDTGILDTKYGEINTRTGELKAIDPKTGKILVSKNIKVDPSTGQITIFGVVDPKTGKNDPTQGRIIEVGQQIDPIVEVTSLSGKYDSKKNVIDPKTALVETSGGQFDPKAGKIDTKYGQIDLVKHTITFTDPKSGKTVTRDIKIDPATGQIILKNQINPKSNKPDKDYARVISLRIVQQRVDPKTKAPIAHVSSAKDKEIIVDPKSNQIWVPTGASDPNTKETQYISSSVDPKTGYVITIYGYLDTKTNEIKKQNKLDPNTIKIEPTSGKIYTATGEVDKATGEPLYATTQVDPESGEVYTKLGRVDPKTGKIVVVRILLISKTDERGRPEEVDPETCEIDPVSGRVLKFFNKTVYVYNTIDPVTGEIIQVDPNDPRFAGARTTVTHTMTLTGEIDPVTGRIKSEYGDIDPNTGDIDPATAVRDPVTGKLILNYAQIDPSHFGKQAQVSTTTETVPITRQQFFDGVKHMGKNALRRDSEESSDDDMTEQYATENIKDMVLSSPKTPGSSTTTTKLGKYVSTPTVVKTTTKQVLTKNDGGVTHNVEEEVRNLGTGEVTFSTQEHKADAPAVDLSGAYVTATAVTTRTATTHEDLGKKAKTEQMEEKTVATTRTHDPNKQEQRVVTQEVKTTATVTSGDQFQRRDSISSTSSGDSGTPIDGPYDGSSVVKTSYKQSPTYETSTSTTTGPHVEQTRVVLGEDVPGYSGHGEILSSQSVSSKTRTVETITYKTERDGIVETRVEQKITIQSDGDPIDHDKALAEAIQEATAMNPDMTVEKIEIQQQSN